MLQANRRIFPKQIAVGADTQSRTSVQKTPNLRRNGHRTYHESSLSKVVGEDVASYAQQYCRRP
jgi:hypothetical protein